MTRAWPGVLLLFVCFSVQAREADPTEVIQLREGNFALPSSQQPGSLVSFGQNIIDAHDLIGFFSLRRLAGNQAKTTQVYPGILYALTDSFSVLSILPWFLVSSNDKHRADLGDVYLQGEYACYTTYTPTRSFQATAVAAVSLPSGSITPSPATGVGACSVFIGTTATYLSTAWLGYTGYGLTMVPTRHGRRRGNDFTYQIGAGRCIASQANGWILTGILELDGDYVERNKINHQPQCNSGGNTITFLPSLWFSTQRFSAQIGCGLVVYEHLFGMQQKKRWFLAATFSWKFNG